MNRYFISILPPEALRAEIKELKEDIRLNFQSAKALNSPAHITLIPPFLKTSEQEFNLNQLLTDSVKGWKPFSLKLNGFDKFSRNKVIFIRVDDDHEILNLYTHLKEQLGNSGEFDQQIPSHGIHPHITIGFRDLTTYNFTKAWEKYQDAAFNRSFSVKSIYLLKHNGKYWDIYREFLF